MHTRLARASESGALGSNFEFLRTHPIPERRIKVSKVMYFVFRYMAERLLLSTLKNSSLKHTRYALPAPGVLVSVIPSNNFLEAWVGGVNNHSQQDEVILECHRH